MKKLILLCCLLAPSMASAQTAPPFVAGANASAATGSGPKFQEVKARMTQRLQEALICVQAAQDIEALKACRPKHPPGEGEHGPGAAQNGGPPPGATNAWTHPQSQPSP